MTNEIDTEIFPCLFKRTIDSPEPFMICGPNHPFSLGFRVHLITDSEFFNSHVVIPSNEMEELIGDNLRHDALAVVHEEQRSYSIYIPRKSTLTRIRLLELIVHEVSHICDFFFHRANVHPCTELRAYTNDWICGLIFQHLEEFE